MSAPLIAPHGRTSRDLALDHQAEWYRGAEARRLADIVVSFQTPAGGWSKNLDLTNHRRKLGESFAPDNASLFANRTDFDAPEARRWDYVGTIDNDGTICELQFLARVVSAIDSKSGELYRTSFFKGLDYLLAAQFPNGGWPQVWPLQGGYHDAITYNDNAMVQVLELLDSVASGTGSFRFVPAEIRARARASADSGIQCILASQIVVNGRRTVWGQQHDMLTLRPVAARNYEPAAQCSAESARLVRFLLTRPHVTPEMKRAAEAAIAWFHQTALYDVVWNHSDDSRLQQLKGAGPLWARYYEIGSNRPIFGERDKTIHDRIGDIAPERRHGYKWYNNQPKRELDAYTQWNRTSAK
jgi:PelA/Pel-15E family pectate lyase